MDDETLHLTLANMEHRLVERFTKELTDGLSHERRNRTTVGEGIVSVREALTTSIETTRDNLAAAISNMREEHAGLLGLVRDDVNELKHVTGDMKGDLDTVVGALGEGESGWVRKRFKAHSDRMWWVITSNVGLILTIAGAILAAAALKAFQ